MKSWAAEAEMPDCVFFPALARSYSAAMNLRCFSDFAGMAWVLVLILGSEAF
jgi:hypothetical protein